MNTTKRGTKKGTTLRRKENRTRFFDPDEWEKFIYSCNNNWRKYFWIMMLTGLRYNEAKHVQIKYIDWKNRWITIIKAKGNKQRPVHLSSYAVKKLRSYISEENLQPDSTFNFPTLQGMRQYMQKRCKEQHIQGWEDLSSHNLRKTHENYLLALNKDNIKVAAHMGHTQKTAMEHYISGAFIKDKKQLDKIRQWLGDIFE